MNMNWVRAITGILVLWSGAAWGATLTWTAGSETDLAGYRVYQCSLLPCARSSSNASVLATLGRVTSYDIGTPSATRYYFVTAFDTSNNESSESSLMTYNPPATPDIGASPTSFSFSAIQGGANPASQTLNISNTGGGTLYWSVSDNTNWLTLSRTSGTGNGSVTLSVTTGTLAAGTYSATVTISATGTDSVTVPVTFTVTSSTSSTPRIGVTPISLSFGMIQGGANPASQTLSISNTGGGTLYWSISDNAAWLTLSRTSGTGNGSVTVSVSGSGLAAGRYSASIIISATGATNVTVPVTFNISSSTSSTPIIGVSPTSLNFVGYVGGSNLPSQTLSITNQGVGTLRWTQTDNVTWLKVDPNSGSGNRVLGVTATPGTLAAGTYRGTITISATGAPTVTVPVTMTVQQQSTTTSTTSPTSLTVQ